MFNFNQPKKSTYLKYVLFPLSSETHVTFTNLQFIIDFYLYKLQSSSTFLFSPQVGVDGLVLTPPTRKSCSRKCLLAFIITVIILLIVMGSALAWYYLGKHLFYFLDIFSQANSQTDPLVCAHFGPDKNIDA